MIYPTPFKIKPKGWAINALLFLCFAGCGEKDHEHSTPANAMTEDAEGPPLFNQDAGPPDIDDATVADARVAVTPIEASEQREGDPEVGYQVLVNEPYVSCGVPTRIYNQFFGSAPASAKLPNRNALNQDKRYYETAFVGANGVPITGTNCLQCHAEYLDGEVVVGLGNSTFDYTRDTTAPARALLAYARNASPAEREVLEKWAQRVQTIAPFVKTKTIGVNPADSLTEVLLAHRDRDTLAWSEEPLLEMDDPYAIPVSVPPWWFMKKKNAMFYTGSGRGDHARFMMSASTLCTDSVEEAAAIDAMFPDVRAFILSIEAPVYPREIDASRAAQGQVLFEQTCAGCHGTYGATETYPNVLVPMDTIGTDAFLSRSAFNAKLEFFEWYNESFYGEAALAVPTSGYVAPPLDGVWATAPYLHNGSIPSLLGVILPQHRPQFWTRDYTVYDVNEVEGGLVFENLAQGHDGSSSISGRSLIYDTTLTGYGNEGHEFGAHLSDEEAYLIVEYLKTL